MSPPGRITDSPVSTTDLVAEFGAAAFDSAIQRPINGLTQLGGKLIGHELPQLHLVDVPKANSGSEVFAQQAGAAVGMLVPFLGTRAAVRGVAGGRLGAGYGAMAAEGGATGFLMGSVLTPVDKDQPFWVSRLANGLTDAGTFATLGVAAKGVSSVKALGLTAETPLLSRIGKGALAGSISGLPAGFAHAELHSLTHGKGLASAAELGGDMAGFALFGGLLGGVAGARSQSRFLSKNESVPNEGLRSQQAESIKKTDAVPVTAPVTVAEGTQIGKPATPQVITEGTRVYTTEEMLRVVEAREAAAKKPAETILRPRKEGFVGEGDEGKVY